MPRLTAALAAVALSAAIAPTLAFLPLLPSAPAAAGAVAGARVFDPGGDRLTHTMPADPRRPLVPTMGSAEGVRLFARDWLHASPQARGPGPAGPAFDRSTCAGCHVEAARRGPGPAPRRSAYRVLQPLRAAHARRFDGQVNTRSSDGRAPEARLNLRHRFRTIRFGDGTVRRLRAPVATAVTAAGERIPVALRAAPLLFGWGLLERVDPEVIRHFHDPEDRDGDGISGRLPNRGGDPERGRGAPGLLGWKAGTATLREQIAKALYYDMGVTTELFPAPDGAVELEDADLDALTEFVRRIGVPASRSRSEPRVRRGERLFGQIGCAACHVPVLTTAEDPQPAFSEQILWPYTDLMLHDMGPELAAPGAESEAREWRTAPLWGLGLIEARRPEHGFLHDGRAADLEEAILWHGGEADASRDAYLGLSRAQREALLAYVRAL